MSKATMKLALEALIAAIETAKTDVTHYAAIDFDICADAIQKGNAALEALAKQSDSVEQSAQHVGEPVGFCKVLTMDDVADIIVNAQSRTPPYEINYMTVMQLTEKAVLEKFK